MSEHIPEAAVEAVVAARYGYASYGPPRVREQIRDDLAAALPHLVSEAAIQRVIRALYDCDLAPEGPHRDNAQAILRAALGIQDEQEADNGR